MNTHTCVATLIYLCCRYN